MNSRKLKSAAFNSPVGFIPYKVCHSHLLLFSRWVVFDALQPRGLQHTRFPCPSLSPRVCLNSRPLSWWCHPMISSSAAPFSSCPQSFPASGCFPMSWLFVSGNQSIGALVSASVLPMNTQGWFPLGLTDLVSLLPKGLSRVFSTTTWKHQFFGAQPSLCVCLLLLIYNCGRKWRRIWQPTSVFLPGKIPWIEVPGGVAKSWTWLSN